MATRHEDRPGRLLTGRFEAFSDGVFAIAITLLVLDITLPDGSEEHLFDALVDLWPSYLAYVVSFSTVGSVWIAHAAVTERLDHVDVWLVRMNLLLLLVVSFLPFPTSVLAASIGEDDDARLAIVLYGATLFVAASLMSLLWRYAVHSGLLQTDLDTGEVSRLTRLLTPALASYLPLTLLGLLAPIVAVLGYLAVALAFLLMPVHRHVRRRT